MRATLPNLLISIGLTATMFLCAPVKAAPESDNQDAAFSLLIEAFGEVQGGFIENDYQSQLRAGESIADPVSRQRAVELARQERNLRLGKLKRQLTEMALAYHYSRPTHEGDDRVSEPEKVDPAAAGRSLKSFVLIGAGTIQTDGETSATKSIITIRRPP